MRLNCTRVEFGRTGYEFKSKMGIAREATQTLIKAYGDNAGEIYNSFYELEKNN